ncbi:DedA family protein [Streptomyces sp. NPDC050433]|uniref:DedA family protein n=1 Tax=Streptomyces sp. NPDC050433 TaxID=3365615 RepID=UPI00379F1F28
MMYMAQVTGDVSGGLNGWAVDVIDALGGLGLAIFTALDSMLFGVLPVDVLLPLVGYSATRGAINIGVAVVCATVGAVVGGVLQYALGAKLGRDRARALLMKIPGIKPDTVDRAEDWFARHGAKAVLFGRVLPVLRPLISIPAGVERMPLPKFVVLTAIGSLMWNSALLGSGYLLGENWRRVTHYAGTFSYIALGALAVAVVVYAVRRRKQAAAPVGESERAEVG